METAATHAEAKKFLGNEQNKQVRQEGQDQKCSGREQWGKEIEFLFSCISLSVGLGNVWRFPFIAFQNGGGAFVVPYIIVLLIIGRPVYYLEIVLGQFSSRGIIKAFDFAPIMRGVAYGQIYTTTAAITYYACIMGLTIRYLGATVSSVLPWGYCRSEWGPSCVDSIIGDIPPNTTIGKNSSAEFYFIKDILREKESIEDGIGVPNWDLVGCLAVAWTIIGIILFRGIRSSGKAAYFLGVFPYIILCVLLIRAVTLPGAINGLIYFFKPQWGELLNPQVWYAAVTQVFFSLAICFGTLIMYASYNPFSRKVYRDILIITTMDSCSSIISGCIIFGILGNLAYETNNPDIASVVKGGAGLAFISYPDAIAKFEFVPQLFAVLFFFMLLMLGVGSNVGMGSCLMTVIRDRFSDLPHWLLAGCISFGGFCLGIAYMTPGGQHVLNLVDYFGASFIALVLAIGELLAIGWVYGIKRFCKDIEFMLGVKTGIYWRICWGIIAPGLMIFVLIYTLLQYEPLTYKNVAYPTAAYAIGWTISAIGLLQLPGWAIYHILKQPQDTFMEKLKSAMKPEETWGPLNPGIYEMYKEFCKELDTCEKPKTGLWNRLKDNICG